MMKMLTSTVSKLAAATAFLAGALTLVAPAQAQLSASYLEPFPPNETYRLQVFGGSLASQLASALKVQLQEEANVAIFSQAVTNGGLARNRRVNMPKQVADKVGTDNFQIAVIMVGSIDRQSMRANGQRFQVGTDGWKQAYGARVDQIIKTLRAKEIAVYWVGMPITSNKARNADMQMLNAIFRERSFRNATRFIDVWDGFTELDGTFSAYGPDLAGENRRLRGKDGVSFTTRGALKLASFVATEIKRDLSTAKSQRAIPLAGDPQDMTRLRQRLEASRLASLASAGRSDGPDAQTPEDAARVEGPFASGTRVRNYPAADGLIRLALPDAQAPGQTRTVDLKLVRPALPSAVVAHIQRRSKQVPFRDQAQLTVPLENGQTMQWLLTPPEQWRTGANRAVPVTQTPFYKVLVKGERLAARPGRADDFRWPPPWAVSRDAGTGQDAERAPDPAAQSAGAGG